MSGRPDGESKGDPLENREEPLGKGKQVRYVYYSKRRLADGSFAQHVNTNVRTLVARRPTCSISSGR